MAKQYKDSEYRPGRKADTGRSGYRDSEYKPGRKTESSGRRYQDSEYKHGFKTESSGRRYQGSEFKPGRKTESSGRRYQDSEFKPGRKTEPSGRRYQDSEYKPVRKTESSGRRFQDGGFKPERNADPERPRWQEFEYIPEQSPLGQAHENDMPEDSYILTGRNPIREALKNGRDLEKLLVQKGELSGSAKEIISTAKAQKVMIQTVEKKRLDEIAPQHQGLIAFASAYQYSTVEEILETAAERNEPPFIILLDGITDPHNLGAVIRTAECAGAHGVIVPQHRSTGLTPAAVKASAGAVEYLKVARVANLNQCIDQLKEKNIWVYAVTMDGADYRTVDFTGPAALVIGAEGSGISSLTEKKCDYAVSLPMKGKLDSLNASVAAGIMMYAVLDARRK